MKRVFSLAVAFLIIISTFGSIVVSASTIEYPLEFIYDDGFLLDDDERYVDFDAAANDRVAYGETIYYPMLAEDLVKGDGFYIGVYESNAVKNIRTKTDWEEGSSYVKTISIVKKRFNGSLGENYDFSLSKYCYFVAITTKMRSSTTTSTHDIYGTVSFRKTGDFSFDYNDMQLDVNIEVGYVAPEHMNTIPLKPALFESDSDFYSDTEETFDFEMDSYSTFVVNTNNQKDIVLGMNNDYDDYIADRFPKASLEFFNGNGGSFNRVGYLYLYAPYGGYMYEVIEGELYGINAQYNRSDETFMIRTRTLGQYVLSDTKLAVPNYGEDGTIDSVFDNDTQENLNPGTGGYNGDYVAEKPAITTAVATPSTIVTQPPVQEVKPQQPAKVEEEVVEEETEETEEEPIVVAIISSTKQFTTAEIVSANTQVKDLTEIVLGENLLIYIGASLLLLLAIIGISMCLANNSKGKYY